MFSKQTLLSVFDRNVENSYCRLDILKHYFDWICLINTIVLLYAPVKGETWYYTHITHTSCYSSDGIPFPSGVYIFREFIDMFFYLTFQINFILNLCNLGQLFVTPAWLLFIWMNKQVKSIVWTVLCDEKKC